MNMLSFWDFPLSCRIIFLLPDQLPTIALHTHVTSLSNFSPQPLVLVTLFLSSSFLLPTPIFNQTPTIEEIPLKAPVSPYLFTRLDQWHFCLYIPPHQPWLAARPAKLSFKDCSELCLSICCLHNNTTAASPAH